ncbi:MAG: HRDC domain-containing protein [Acutalibacteraceae bacterium]|nr:HRDC domain-containing protein [Acutalibacteraceae bacterium]
MKKNIVNNVDFNIGDNNSPTVLNTNNNDINSNKDKIDNSVNQATDKKDSFDINNENVDLSNKINDNNLKQDSENIDNMEELPVYKALKNYRYNQSKIEKVKAYYIFNNLQIEALIKANPKTICELKNIKGFAEVKCSKYGEDILKILKEYS